MIEGPEWVIVGIFLLAIAYCVLLVWSVQDDMKGNSHMKHPPGKPLVLHDTTSSSMKGLLPWNLIRVMRERRRLRKSMSSHGETKPRPSIPERRH